MDIQKPSPHQFPRHPGAALFIWASAVSNDRSALRNVLQVFLDFTARHSNGASQPVIGFTPILQAARVNESEALPAIHSFYNLRSSELVGLHCSFPCDTVFQGTPLITDRREYESACDDISSARVRHGGCQKRVVRSGNREFLRNGRASSDKAGLASE
jgi:hypothetical protein